MRTHIAVAALLFCVVRSANAEPSDKEILALINQVEDRVAGGDAKALDELTTLPVNIATAVLLNLFKLNYNIADATPQNRAIGLRCAQLATATPAAEDYLVKLLKGKPSNNAVYFQQDSAIKSLVAVHNERSVRILGGSLADLDPEEIGPKVARALAALRLPGAPISPTDRVNDEVALTKWKQWWDGNTPPEIAGEKPYELSMEHEIRLLGVDHSATDTLLQALEAGREHKAGGVVLPASSKFAELTIRRYERCLGLQSLDQYYDVSPDKCSWKFANRRY